MRARVEGDELIAEFVLFAEGGTVGGRIEHGWIGAVGDQLHLPGATGADVLDKARAVDHDAIGAAVEKPLQPFRETDQHAALQHADGDGKLRPEIAHLEEESGALEPGENPSGDTLEDGRRGSPHKVDLTDTKADPER